MRTLGTTILLCLAACAAAPAAPPGPLVGLTGTDSEVREPDWLLLRSAEELLTVWRHHRFGEGAADGMLPPDSPPDVDFARCDVLAVFTGRVFQSQGLRAVELREETACRRLRYDHLTYQSHGPGKPRRVYVYGLFVVPRSRLPVVFEENTQNLLGGEPIWTERARVAPPR